MRDSDKDGKGKRQRQRQGTEKADSVRPYGMTTDTPTVRREHLGDPAGQLDGKKRGDCRAMLLLSP